MNLKKPEATEKKPEAPAKKPAAEPKPKPDPKPAKKPAAAEDEVVKPKQPKKSEPKPDIAAPRKAVADPKPQGKVLSLLEACFDLISPPSPSMKIQIMGGKMTENLGFHSPLRKVKIFFVLFLFIFKFSIKNCISLFFYHF